MSQDKTLFANKVIDFFLILLSIVLLVVSFYLPIFKLSEFYFSNSDILAYKMTASVFLMPIAAFIIAFVIGLHIDGKRPVIVDYYNIEKDRNKLQHIYNISNKRKYKATAMLNINKKFRKNLKIGTVLCFIAIILWFFGLFGRCEIHGDTYRTYSMFNTIENECSISDTTSYTIGIYYISSGRSAHYNMILAMKIYSGEEYYFYFHDFRDVNALKEFVGMLDHAQKTVENSEDLGVFMSYYNFSDLEKSFLYELFNKN